MRYKAELKKIENRTSFYEVMVFNNQGNLLHSFTAGVDHSRGEEAEPTLKQLVQHTLQNEAISDDIPAVIEGEL